MLYLREQVEAFALKKWGGEEGLDAEYERRQTEKQTKHSKRFEDKLKDLRRRTTKNVWQKRQDERHVHDFQELSDPITGAQIQRCSKCGFQIESVCLDDQLSPKYAQYAAGGFLTLSLRVRTRVIIKECITEHYLAAQRSSWTHHDHPIGSYDGTDGCFT